MGGKPVHVYGHWRGKGRYFFLYFLVFIVLVVAYSLTGFGILETLSTVVNCLSNLGSPYSLIGKDISYVGLPVWNRLVLYFAMILGRVELFTMVMVLSPGILDGQTQLVAAVPCKAGERLVPGRIRLAKEQGHEC